MCCFQCCGSGTFIPDSKLFHPGSQIRIPDPGVKKAPDPGSTTLVLSKTNKDILKKNLQKIIRFSCQKGSTTLHVGKGKRYSQLTPVLMVAEVPHHAPHLILQGQGAQIHSWPFNTIILTSSNNSAWQKRETNTDIIPKQQNPWQTVEAFSSIWKKIQAKLSAST